MMYILIFSFSIIALTVNSQNVILKDTLNSEITFSFNKVKPSFKETRTATMNVYLLKKLDLILIRINMLSFWYRANTSLTDYCIIKSKATNIKLYNQIITNVGGPNNNMYTFNFVISKDSLMNVLTTNFKKITMFFTPNSNIKKYILRDTPKLTAYTKHAIKLSKKTIKYKIFNPNEKQMNELIAWLSKL